MGGVPGLSVLTEAFTEDCERRYWDAAPGSGNQSAGETKRVGQCSIDHPLAMFGAVHEAISLVEDTGLFAPICRPDYILVQAYPPKASFMSHYDSKFRWGETVVGVCLGAPCEMLFTPNDKSLPNVRVWLPRRSIYVMAGDSRRLWKHGLFRAGMAGLEGREQARPPSFNPLNWRRSWTLRSTKVYQQAWLESRRDAAPAGSAARAALSARLAAQLEFMPPQAGGPHEKLVGADFDAVHAQAVAMLADVDRSPAPRVRMRAADAGASLQLIGSPALRAAYTAGAAPAAAACGGGGGGGGRGGGWGGGGGGGGHQWGGGGGGGGDGGGGGGGHQWGGGGQVLGGSSAGAASGGGTRAAAAGAASTRAAAAATAGVAGGGGYRAHAAGGGRGGSGGGGGALNDADDDGGDGGDVDDDDDGGQLSAAIALSLAGTGGTAASSSAASSSAAAASAAAAGGSRSGGGGGGGGGGSGSNKRPRETPGVIDLSDDAAVKDGSCDRRGRYMYDNTS